MESFSEFKESWRLFLVEFTFLKSVAIDPMPGLPGGSTAPQEHFQPFIASLFYLRMVSLLETGLQKYIDDTQLTLPKGYRGRLVDMIDLIKNEMHLFNSDALHIVREQRNAIAHEEKVKVNWQKVDDDLVIVHAELQQLNLVGPKPLYEIFGERNPVKPNDPNSFRANRFNCGVQEGNKRILEFSWTMNYYRQGTMAGGLGTLSE